MGQTPPPLFGKCPNFIVFFCEGFPQFSSSVKEYLSLVLVQEKGTLVWTQDYINYALIHDHLNQAISNIFHIKNTFETNLVFDRFSFHLFLDIIYLTILLLFPMKTRTMDLSQVPSYMIHPSLTRWNLSWSQQLLQLLPLASLQSYFSGEMVNHKYSISFKIS